MQTLPALSLGQLAVMWGPGVLILGGLFVLARSWLKQKKKEREAAMKLVNTFAEQFLQSSRDQADAVKDLAGEISKQNTESSEDRELLKIGMRRIHEELSDQTKKLDDIWRATNGH